MNKLKILAFGEINMRLTPPEHKLLEQTTQVDLSFTGTGVNVLSGLHQFGLDTSMFTILPDNRVGDAAKKFIRKLGIDDNLILSNGNHIGSFIAEMGYGPRPTNVTYLNRSHSAFCTTKLREEQIVKALEGIDLIHVCGISLATSEISRENTLYIVEIARSLEIKICFDFNYRPSLNNNTYDNELIKSYKRVLTSASIVFGSERDLTDLLGISLAENKYTRIQSFLKDYSIDCFAGTIKKNSSKDRAKKMKGFIITNTEFHEADWKLVQSFDRIGAGDAYTAGVLTGILNDWDTKATVNFATVASLLSYTTSGDSPLLSKKLVEHVMNHPNDDIIR